MASRRSLGANPKRNSMGPQISNLSNTPSKVNAVEKSVTENFCEQNNNKGRISTSGAIARSSSVLSNKTSVSSNRRSLPSKVSTTETNTSNKTTRFGEDHTAKKVFAGAHTTKNVISSQIFSSNNIKLYNVKTLEIPTSNTIQKKHAKNNSTAACINIKPPKVNKMQFSSSNKTKEVVKDTVNKSSSASNVQKNFISSNIASISSNNIKTSKAAKIAITNNVIVSNKPCAPNNIKPSKVNTVETPTDNNVVKKRTNDTSSIIEISKSKNEIKPSNLKVETRTTNKSLEFVCEEIGPNIIRLVEKIPQRDTYGRTLLHILCSGGGFEKLMEFRTVGYEIKSGGQLGRLRDIIESGADINAVDWLQNTPLHEAVAAGHEEFAELLLQSGALPNVRDNDYDTPLHRACQLHNVPLVNLLLKYGADVKATNFSGESIMNVSSTRIQQLLQQTNSKNNILPVFYMDRSQNVFISEISEKTKEFLLSKHFKCLPLTPFYDGAFCVIGDSQNIHHVEVLRAILKGIMVLRERDLKIYLSKDEVIQPKLIPEEIRLPVLKSIKNNLNRLPKLFDRLNFYILSHSSSIIKFHEVKFSLSHLSLVIKEGGGNTLMQPPTERNDQSHRPFHMQNNQYTFDLDTNFIVYDRRDPPFGWNNKNQIRHVSSDWVLDCVCNFNITV